MHIYTRKNNKNSYKRFSLPISFQRNAVKHYVFYSLRNGGRKASLLCSWGLGPNLGALRDFNPNGCEGDKRKARVVDRSRLLM